MRASARRRPARDPDPPPPTSPPGLAARATGAHVGHCGGHCRTARPHQTRCSGEPSRAASGDPWRSFAPPPLANTRPAPARSPASGAPLWRPGSALLSASDQSPTHPPACRHRHRPSPWVTRDCESRSAEPDQFTTESTVWAAGMMPETLLELATFATLVTVSAATYSAILFLLFRSLVIEMVQVFRFAAPSR